MKQWHCAIGGKQYGPVEESVLRQWISEGRIGLSDMVWAEGMAEWVALSSVPELSFSNPLGSFAAPQPTNTEFSPPPAQSAGGQTSNAELMTQARAILSGRWGLAIGTMFLYLVITTVISNIPYLGSIASLVLSGPFQLGIIFFALRFTRRQRAELGNIFEGFQHFGRALGAYLLQVLFVLLWSLLLIIPGIIASLSYSQTFYILADNPSIGPMEAIGESKKMMNGYKWKLFCLGFRFFGWSLLCLLTCGIGYLWLFPYMAVSFARFYDDLRGASNPAGVGDQTPDAHITP